MNYSKQVYDKLKKIMDNCGKVVQVDAIDFMEKGIYDTFKKIKETHGDVCYSFGDVVLFEKLSFFNKKLVLKSDDANRLFKTAELGHNSEIRAGLTIEINENQEKFLKDEL